MENTVIKCNKLHSLDGTEIRTANARNPRLQSRLIVRHQVAHQIVAEAGRSVAGAGVGIGGNARTPRTYPQTLRAIVPVVFDQIGGRHNAAHRTVRIAEQHHFAGIVAAIDCERM